MAPHCSSVYETSADSSVWVVDDDEDDQLFISSAFRGIQKTVQVRTLTDGDQLIPQLTNCTQLPRLILLDINMARQNGFETLEQIRSTPPFAHLPIIMLTTSSDSTDRQRSLALGANQYLTKPADYNKLVALVEDLAEQWALA